MRRIFGFGLLIMALALSGCVMRLIPREMDRVDQELKGNRGFLVGDPNKLPESKRDKRDTRTVYDLEIEVSSPMDARKSGKTKVKKENSDKKEYGNRGYLQTKTVSEKDLKPVEGRKSSGGALLKSSEPQVIYQKGGAVQGKYKQEKGEGTIVAIKQAEAGTYVVEKGDTLQKISQKMYGTTKRWKKIYEANKEVLKSPDMIRAGQKLVIPE
ncbi:MAG: LysM peptidoglycan-binding domain-containing protein [Candidatus Omnitrophica bacterium]|nr:LysM peptidoglycan-binding domain-containing protein [Candidatus Omnitrophota bacterium]MBU1933005.1 LysM peptidoglycan-binding domain-containing protein [Candidatus Omnitrophota bacterium]